MVTDGSHPAAKRGFPAHVSPAPRNGTGDAEPPPPSLSEVSGADPSAGGRSAGLGAGADRRRGPSVPDRTGDCWVSVTSSRRWGDTCITATALA